MQISKEAAIKEVQMLAFQIQRMNEHHGLLQEDLVFEEISECIKELCDMQKSIVKKIRGLDNTDHVVEEVCDVYASSYILLKQLGVSDDEIFHRMTTKYKRGLERGL